MFEAKSIRIRDIVVSDRIRPVDEDHAQVIAASIAANGLINPVTIRATPNAKGGKYTLVAGAHRLRACVINKAEEIDAIIVKGDQTASKLLEVTENLIRNDLSVIDRAAHVQVLRDLYEEENGEIKPGNPQLGQVAPIRGDQKSKGQVAPLIENNCFAQYVSDRLGLSKDAIKRLNRISHKLNPQLRECLRQTPLADNQAALLKLAKKEQAEQQRIAATMEQTNGDIRQAAKAVEGKLLTEKADPQAGYLSKIISLLEKLDADHLAKFNEYYHEFSTQSEAA